MSERWWVISETAFVAAMHRAAAGEEPELLLMEHYANSGDSEGGGQP